MQPGDIIPEASSFSNFKMILAGFNIIKFSSFGIHYEAESAINTGKDGEPVSWSIKKFKRSAKTTLLIEALKELITLAPGGDLLKLPPFPVTGETTVAGVGTLRIEVPAVKITKFDLDFKDGDDKTEVPIELLVVSYPVITYI